VNRTVEVQKQQKNLIKLPNISPTKKNNV